MKRSFAVLLAALMVSAGIFAQETVSGNETPADGVAEITENADEVSSEEGPEKKDFSSCRITKISIKNLKRTKESVILDDLKPFIDKNADAATLKGLGMALMRQGMIESSNSRKREKVKSKSRQMFRKKFLSSRFRSFLFHQTA